MALRALDHARFMNGTSTVRWVYDDETLELHGIDVVTNNNINILTARVRGPAGIARTVVFPAGHLERMLFPPVSRMSMRAMESDANFALTDITVAALADPVFLAEIIDGTHPDISIMQPSGIGMSLELRLLRSGRP